VSQSEPREGVSLLRVLQANERKLCKLAFPQATMFDEKYIPTFTKVIFLGYDIYTSHESCRLQCNSTMAVGNVPSRSSFCAGTLTSTRSFTGGESFNYKYREGQLE